MAYSTQRGTDGADRYKTRKIDARLATIEDDIDSGAIGGGGGGGAPTNAAYVTIGANATLTGERALTAGTGITIADGGANSTVTINASGNAADLTSGTLPDARMPALTGDVTTTVGTVATTIANSVVSNAKLANVATSVIKGRLTAGAGVVEDLTFTQVAQNLDTFTSGAKGVVPGSGGGTTKFLRADATWAAPTVAPMTDAQSFTTAGAATWTKPTSFAPTFVRVVAYGGGGGGGGGGSQTGAVVRCGGGGGGGGARIERIYRAADLGATESITVGAGGTAGTAGASGGAGGAGPSRGGTRAGTGHDHRRRENRAGRTHPVRADWH